MNKSRRSFIMGLIGIAAVTAAEAKKGGSRSGGRRSGGGGKQGGGGGGCGSKGGPGYRKPDGKCASWKD